MAGQGKGGKKRGHVDYIQERGHEKSAKQRNNLRKAIACCFKDWQVFFTEIQHFIKNVEVS